MRALALSQQANIDVYAPLPLSVLASANGLYSLARPVVHALGHRFSSLTEYFKPSWSSHRKYQVDTKKCSWVAISPDGYGFNIPTKMDERTFRY